VSVDNTAENMSSMMDGHSSGQWERDGKLSNRLAPTSVPSKANNFHQVYVAELITYSRLYSNGAVGSTRLQIEAIPTRSKELVAGFHQANHKIKNKIKM
jgi:hypothetical protein